ncbi:SLIT-ROBO Rho GTPase-activating protein 3-like isoform X1 [Sinocyclocheilus rhinocerous]|uniref:Rho GTPase-activating protein 4-like n=1 Tax=Sinocyclocheilus rhinocerous TaxID=307959 RepID=A0A673MBH0_9TELE|nr:PREDICTED: SLIT-ROBO Rho GTPase-activating protein 3-like isoform X1 [Sinocyclocheilus rhinocerous]XP_016377973.1 PREDICTED: SLIT-ROBO Rho GTPase-activating protein 3-like isoform X1 [Sinocyclocheilus rhinocerous]
MSSHVKLWRDRVGTADYDTQFKEVRLQLAEQLRIFDGQVEQKTQVFQDLIDYLRRRGEIEGEYARSLDKLCDRFSSRTRKKEPSHQSVVNCWQVLLTQTRQESRDHSFLSDSYSNTLPQQLSHCAEHAQRLAKRSRDICTQLQDGLLKVTTELHTTLKTYYQYYTEFLSAEGKLKEAVRLEEKQKQSASKKMERQIEKRQCKVQEIQLKCTKARNDYLLNLAAANACMNKYYLQDLSTLIDCCDLGYHQSISKVFHFYLASRQWAQQNLSTGMQQLDTTVSELNQNQDRDTLMQANISAFCLPLRFQYQPYEGDQVVEVSAKCEMLGELVTRFHQLQSRLSSVTMEVEESGKLLQSAQSSMLDGIVEDTFGSAPDIPSSPPSPEGDVSVSKTYQLKRRASLPDTESLYFSKVRDHLCNSSLISKLEAKHDLLKVAIQKAESVDSNHSRTRSKRSVRHKKSYPGTQISQKLFSGDLLSYIQASGQLIPAVVESCIRFINLNGLHHEGLFRVPGSQMVVNQLKDAFEKGDDPLADGGCDMDSVAGVLKLYFRGLMKPLFPEDSYEQLMECGQIDDETKKITQLKCIISSYPASLIIVMRYLFAFLHHVSQYSDENMMQPYNLAVCFGPSLVRGPNNGDAAELQRINSLVKSIIIQHESIFPSQNELPGPVYEKCMALEEEDCEAVAEEGDGESEQSQMKEAKDELQGVALFDYKGRSSAELSFKHGDCLILHSKASSDWWRGELNGTKGLIPNKYISVPSMDGDQDQKGKETLKSSCGRQQTEEEQKAEQSTRLKVTSDKAGVGPSHVTSGKVSLQIPTGPYAQPGNSPGALRKTLDPQMRRSTADGGSREEFSTAVDKEVHNMMHSVFKELHIRQSSPDQNTSTTSEITSSVQTPPNRGPGWKGKGLFRSADNAD